MWECLSIIKIILYKMADWNNELGWPNSLKIEARAFVLVDRIDFVTSEFNQTNFVELEFCSFSKFHTMGQSSYKNGFQGTSQCFERHNSINVHKCTCQHNIRATKWDKEILARQHIQSIQKLKSHQQQLNQVLLCRCSLSFFIGALCLSLPTILIFPC